MVIDDFNKRRLTQTLEGEWLSERDVRLDVLRLDLIHPVVSGNKWFKLKENIRLAQAQNKSVLLTFGGQWSNHLIATAAAACHYGLRSIGLVCQRDPEAKLTATLQSCRSYGMSLLRLSPDDYRKRHDPAFIEKWSSMYPGAYLIPEGGNNITGIEGVREMAKLFPAGLTHIALPVGTGTTFAGVRMAADSSIKLLGFCPFKKVAEQRACIAGYCKNWPDGSWRLFHDTVWRGFGRMNDALFRFVNEYYQQFHIPLDVVYTGKMMYYLERLIHTGRLPPGSHVLAVHTGGLQGNASVREHLIY
ncbi:MAG TPA: pyridoxal-phosphate dependent enzyme [Edaphocola sp.]|nr:pyridoxal-phosphate dependent enzyme [Edaphocola sp.]